MLAQQDSRQHRNNAVAVQLRTVGQHCASAVHIGIKDNTKIGFGLGNGGLDSLHCRGIFGVGDVVGERTVRLQELTTSSIRTQRLQYLVRIETACAVASVHNNLESLQRAILPGCGTHLIDQNGGVVVHKGTRLHGSRQQTCDFLASGIGQNGGNVLLLQTAILGKELKAIAVKGQMACGNHHRTVIRHLARDGTHKHGRGRSHADIRHRNALLAHGVAQPICQLCARQTRITANGYAQGILTHAVTQPQRKATADIATNFLGQIDRLPLDSFESHTADIASILQFLIIHNDTPLIPYEINGTMLTGLYHQNHRNTRFQERVIFIYSAMMRYA